MELEIRAIGRDELKVLSRVHHDAWTQAYTSFYPEWFLAERSPEFFHGLWYTFLDDDQRLVSAAMVGGRFCGFVRYGRPAAESRPSSSRSGELLTMYILRSERGKGIGTRLLKYAEARMRELGYRDALLFVVQDLHGSVAFYEANGWRWTGEYESIDLGGYSPEMLRMEKILAEE
ncbi:MAG: hypothetical protein DLM55_08710 [Acidimicrobiales bacterium]|nr:MAG: hypothetical protein DLM55_08710 [Acidimicrobiales bacterium]